MRNKHIFTIWNNNNPVQINYVAVERNVGWCEVVNSATIFISVKSCAVRRRVITKNIAIGR